MTSLAPSSDLMVRVLGPVDLRCGDQVVVLGGRSERAILAALAVSANHWVSADQLAEILWQGEPPPSWRNTLQTYVSRLKHRLGDTHLRGEGHSYQLLVPTEELDALVFERDVLSAERSRSDPERCLEICRAALKLWRGPPFGDLGDDEPFLLEAIRLNELRLHVMEIQLECQLVTDREDVAVAALEPLVHEYPYRERLWYLLVYGLAVTGRRVEALRSCRSLRSLLAEVGLEPSSDMDGLEDEILTESPRVRPRLSESMPHHGSRGRRGDGESLPEPVAGG